MILTESQGSVEYTPKLGIFNSKYLPSFYGRKQTPKTPTENLVTLYLHPCVSASQVFHNFFLLPIFIYMLKYPLYRLFKGHESTIFLKKVAG